MSNEFILEMKDIKKEFPGVKALNGVNLEVRKGSVHGLMGENGAGKSTLMKILMGIYKPDHGTITLNGKKTTLNNIRAALSEGISMIHQELSPIPEMTIAENIYLGREPTILGGWVKEKGLLRKTEELFEELEIDLDPKAKMSKLSIANTQVVEIAKAISYNSKLIIMDEPTSAISDREVNHLFKMIRNLVKRNVSIIYITHKMEELNQIADEVTVLRDGNYVGTESIKNVTKDQIIKMMVGRELSELFDYKGREFSDKSSIALSVKNITQEGVFHDISFNVRKGEILGISGLVGSGRTEIIESVFGVTKRDSGDIEVNGKQVEINSPRDAIKNGMGLLTEDRKQSGCFLPLNIIDNMAISNIDKYRSGLGLLNKRKMNDDCMKEKERLSIKTPNFKQLIENLSGGNQQKVLLARWLLRDPDILFLDEPTRGVDIGAKSEIYDIIFGLAKKGKAIVVISSEMPEILGLSDRIMVMSEGYKTGEILRDEASQEKIMNLATIGKSSNKSVSVS